MWRTALACIALTVMAYTAANWLTHNFQVWTAEGARRLDAALHPVSAPRIAMDSSDTAKQRLDQLLIRENAVTIVDFVYTRCATVCLALGSTFQQMQLAIRDDENTLDSAPLRLLSISFDPVHDDGPALATYAAGLRADSRVWRFVRVADHANNRRLLDAYQVTVIPDGFGGFEHNAALLVVDTRGRLVRIFDYADRDIAISFARSLATTQIRSLSSGSGNLRP